MCKLRSLALVRIPRLFFSPTRAAILTMCILGFSFSSSTSRQTGMSTRPLGWSPRVEPAEPYPFLTFAGNPLSSFLILLVTPRGLRQFSLTRLYLQLSWRLNSGFDPAISHFAALVDVCAGPFPETYIPSRKTRRSFFLIFVLS